MEEKQPQPMLPGQGFDPMRDFNFTGMQDDPDYEEYIPPIEKPEDYDEPVQVSQEPPTEERIAAVFRGMPGLEKLLAHVIEYCAEEKDSEAVLEELEAYRGNAVSLYAGDVICANLVRAGALEIIALDADSTDETAAADSGEEGSEVENEDENRVQVARFNYVATPAGLEAAARVRDEVPLAQAKLFEGNEIYLPIHLRILEAAQAPEGVSKKAIDAMVDHDPICENPRRYSGYFVKALEAAEAMTFDGMWHITDYGRQLLKEYAS